MSMMGTIAMLEDEGLSGTEASGAIQPRRRWPVAEKRRIVLESLAPGASVSRVARCHEVNANQVFAWRKLYREGSLDGVGGLVPVMVVAEAPEPSSSLSPNGGSGRMTIDLGGGTRILVDATVDGAALERVLSALAGR